MLARPNILNVEAPGFTALPSLKIHTDSGPMQTMRPIACSGELAATESLVAFLHGFAALQPWVPEFGVQRPAYEPLITTERQY